MLQFGGDIDDPMEKALLMTEQMNVMAAASKEGSRITSYNVCYTKLLRMSKNLLVKVYAEGTTGRVDIIGNISEWNQNNAVEMRSKCEDVITSYSIHYTKLYEIAA